LIPIAAPVIFATTKNVLKNLTRVTLLLAEPELLVPQKAHLGQKLVLVLVLLDPLVIPDKNVLRVNANGMKNVLIQKLVKTTIV
jgi:hypothetical protein